LRHHPSCSRRSSRSSKTTSTRELSTGQTRTHGYCLASVKGIARPMRSAYWSRAGAMCAKRGANSLPDFGNTWPWLMKHGLESREVIWKLRCPTHLQDNAGGHSGIVVAGTPGAHDGQMRPTRRAGPTG
jgi:hypothetical protein